MRDIPRLLLGQDRRRRLDAQTFIIGGEDDARCRRLCSLRRHISPTNWMYPAGISSWTTTLSVGLRS
jgi:hypothetical protein